MSDAKPILSVVEALEGIHLQDFIADVKKPEFWLPLLPVREKRLTLEQPNEYRFFVAETVKMDPTGTLKYDFTGEGVIHLVDHGNQGNKGRLWELKIELEKPKSFVHLRVRARDDGSKLKVGVYLVQLDMDLGAMNGLGFGKDGILFAGRVKIREVMQQFASYVRSKK